VEALDHAQLERLTGTAVYAGGMLDRRNGTVQPLAYTRGLAAAAIRHGAKVHGGARVLRLRRDGALWRVKTTVGELACVQVLVCTNAFTGDLVPRLQRSVLPVHGVQVATAPLPEDIARTILPHGQSCADTHKLRVRYFRMEPDGRLVIGGPGWLTPPRDGRALSFKILEHSTRRMFPQIGDVEFEYRWYGRGAMTADLLPHLHEARAGVMAAIGYNGRGIAAGTALGTLLARRALGESLARLPFPVTPLSALPFNATAAAHYHATVALRRIRDIFTGG
jgi:glycine/D-amino acid oxidase-like deaminating enzyme